MLEVSEEARNRNLSFIATEKALGTPRHDLLGEAIGESWDLPEYLVKVCRYHHTYSREQRMPDQSCSEKRKQLNNTSML